MADNSGGSGGGGSDNCRDGSVGVYVWEGFGHTQLFRDCVALPSLNTLVPSSSRLTLNQQPMEGHVEEDAGDYYRGQAWEVVISLPTISHWTELCHMFPSHCKGVWNAI